MRISIPAGCGLTYLCNRVILWFILSCGLLAEKEDGIEDEMKEGWIIESIIFVTQFPFFYLGILTVTLLPALFFC